MNRVSVVVPTRDRPRSLARCLGALARQDCLELEVVVVDDGSRDRAAVAAAVDAAPGAKAIRLSGVGPAAARNVGARAATGELICFTDDDCEPDPGWARLLAEAATEHGAATGRTKPPPGATPTALAAQAITNHLLEESVSGGLAGFAPTCNLGVARPLLARVPFDERFTHAGGEDRDWSARAAAAGSPPRYEPGALVVHRQALTTSGFLRQQYRYGRGAARFRAAHPGRGLERGGFYAGLVRRGFAEGPAAGALVLAAQAATAAGIGTEWVRGRRS